MSGFEKMVGKALLPAPYDGKPFLGIVNGSVKACCYKKNDYSDDWNFWCLEDEGDLQYLPDADITEWRPMADLAPQPKE